MSNLSHIHVAIHRSNVHVTIHISHIRIAVHISHIDLLLGLQRDRGMPALMRGKLARVGDGVVTVTIDKVVTVVIDEGWVVACSHVVEGRRLTMLCRHSQRSGPLRAMRVRGQILCWKIAHLLLHFRIFFVQVFLRYRPLQ